MKDMKSLDGLQFDLHSPHVESYFLKANDPTGARAIWLKMTVLCTNAGRRVAEAWAITFERGKRPSGAKARVAFEDAWFSRETIGARIANCELDATRAKGSLGAGPQAIEFDLSIHNAMAGMYPLEPWVYALPISSNKPTSPLPDARISGTIRTHGQTWTLDGWHGLLGHNWGKAHTHAYAWAQCNAWDDHDDVVFEMGIGKARVGLIPIPTITIINLRVRGVRYDLSTLADVRNSRGDFDFRSAHLKGHNELVSVQGEFHAETVDTAGLHYENPDGSVCYCLNSKLSTARVEVALRGRAPFVLNSKRAALEIGTRNPEHGVEMIL
jgi:Tocopherol cyclase